MAWVRILDQVDYSTKKIELCEWNKMYKPIVIDSGDICSGAEGAEESCDICPGVSLASGVQE